jgi:molybdopterin-containing oxidoreductase family iron-sulfur binding subunit
MNSTSPIPRYWRSLDEAAQKKAYLESSAGEFREKWDVGIGRRDFLKWIGASAGLLGLNACTREPIRPIVPYVTQPENLVPGQPLHYATAMPLDGFAVGLVVESHEGHPTKIEGNPKHSASLGATGIFEQASLLDLYNPWRPRAITNGGQVSDFPSFLAALNNALNRPRNSRGAGLCLLSHAITSPALLSQIDELLRQFPEARWRQYQPLSRDNSLEGARLALGRPIETRFRMDKAKTIVLLDADCFFLHPARLVHARQFADNRRNPGVKPISARMYAAEPTPSISGAMADHRVAATSAEVERMAFALALEIGLTVHRPAGELAEPQRQWVKAAAAELQQNRGAGLFIAGEPQPPAVHTLAHFINDHLGNVGTTLEYAEPADTHWVNHIDSVTQLAADLDSGGVDCLVILGGNPVFDAPADLKFAEKMAKARFCVHLSTELNETSAASHWHIPASHFLESWGDARAIDGTVSIIQPLIMRLYDSKTASELLYAINHHDELRDDYDIVRQYWQSQKPGEDFENWWRQSLHEGLIDGTQSPLVSIKPRGALDGLTPSGPDETGLEICFRPDPCIWDGRFADNAWLQELPKPFSKIVWDNPALISPALASRLQLETGDVVKLNVSGRVVSLPIWITHGQAENSITAHPGLGRSHVGPTGKDVGFNCYVTRTAKSPWGAGGLSIVKTNSRHHLVTTQHSHNVHGRDILESHAPEPARNDTLYNPHEFDQTDYAWGMAIDLNACIGCNACVIACQSENNIPVVGKDQVDAGRDMQWIRIDQYFEGTPGNPRIYNQPVPCMHCENAPCELVCPVGATLHDHQGLNLQVYNRCVGTRYCSNNCPYKVRRFNFFRYADYDTPSLKPMRNPNVTVRWRGVMEKCSYCLQRISAARIASELRGQPIGDGEIKTACQQVCPAQAITFGNIKDPNSAVSKLKSSPLNYSMLGELNTRPRTTYLKRAPNRNPDLEEKI